MLGYWPRLVFASTRIIFSEVRGVGQLVHFGNLRVEIFRRLNPSLEIVVRHLVASIGEQLVDLEQRRRRRAKPEVQSDLVRVSVARLGTPVGKPGRPIAM